MLWRVNIMKNNKNFEVREAQETRKGFRIYYDFRDCKLLNGEEKLMFIILKSFLDFSLDKGSTKGDVYPSIKTIGGITQWGDKKIMKVINSLVKKGYVKKIRRGLNKPNIYIIADCAETWKAENPEEAREIIENDGKKPMTEDEHLAALEKMGYDVALLKKAKISPETEVEGKAEHDTNDNTAMPVNKPVKNEAIKNQSETNTGIKENNIIIDKKSQQDTIDNQDEYTMDFIKQNVGYDDVIAETPENTELIDTIIRFIYDTVNSGRPAIRVNGTDMSREVVTSTLLKLNKEDILYTVKKYKEVPNRIKNPKSYILAILYNCKQQRIADEINKKTADENKQNPGTAMPKQRNTNQFTNFEQRQVTNEELDELEKMLLKNSLDKWDNSQE